MLKSHVHKTASAVEPTSSSIPPVEFARWAADLYQESEAEPPLRGAVFSIEQLELHARFLAVTHVLGHDRSDSWLLGMLVRGRPKTYRRDVNWLLRRIADSDRLIGRCHELMAGAQAGGGRLTPAAEWLLDNHYLVEEQVWLARKHFPRGYSRRLPRLARGEHSGLPRVYDLILEFIAHVDARIDDEALSRYVAAYQSSAHLTLGELWAVPIMLRLALIENLRRITASISWKRAHRDSAVAWARRIGAFAGNHENALLALADMIRESPLLTTTFAAQFAHALQGRGATTKIVLDWLEQRLVERGLTIEEVVRAESQSQAADQASMANSIASLRLVNATEWDKFVEANSVTEKILRDEPALVYARMDFATRDEYRHVVERLALRFHTSEEVVARTSVAMATAHYATQSSDAAGHVGYMLVDEGRSDLERALRGDKPLTRPPQRTFLRGLMLLAYLGPIALLSTALALVLLAHSARAPEPEWFILGLCAILAASQCAIASTNWVISLIGHPRALPRMDFEQGISDECRTIVVVPTLLAGKRRIVSLLEGLELRYLSNRDPNLWFALLTDLADADCEHVDGDEALLEQVTKGIEALNARYEASGCGRFFLFHRSRQYNEREGCWMGRERKRGKLEEFNALLCGGDRTCFSRIVGDVSLVTSIRYVITLDTDTDLPWGAGWHLVGAAAHPLNRATMDVEGRRLIRGYAILQPRVSISLRSAAQSHYSRLLAGEVGIDPYTRVVSDLYQDLFAEASFVGKGIYDVGAFRQLLEGRFPDNAVLSHDLLESCYARSGQCSDVELLEDSPSGYLADVSRRHRWMRGDWQIVPWLGLRVSDATGMRLYPSIAALGWWKIFDNLRRALVAPAYTVLLTLGWLVLPFHLTWTAVVLSLLFIPELLPGLAELWQRPPKLPVWIHVRTVGLSTLRRLAKITLWLAFLPFEAWVALDAAIRSLWRMLFSRKRLLEWQTAAAVESASVTGFGHMVRQMWVGPLLSAAVALLLLRIGTWRDAISVVPILMMWVLSPVIAWWVSRPLRSDSLPVADEDIRFLRRIARLTWRYFEVFAGPQENWLPPDNFQERPGPRVAHRTSPTNMGLGLLSNLSAHDLGYLSGAQLVDRTSHALDSMEVLERHRGHFYNWYETSTRKPLRPHYVSTVDSGNLVGHLRVLRTGLLDLRTDPVLPLVALEGLRDTFRILAEKASSTAALKSVGQLLLDPTDSLSAKLTWLKNLSVAASQMSARLEQHPAAEAAWWAAAFDRQVQAFLVDLTELAPWLECGADQLRRHAQPWIAELERPNSLQELGRLAWCAAEALETEEPTVELTWLVEAFRLSAQRIEGRVRQLDDLALRCTSLTDAEFSFLYDRKRKLLSIGYWVADRRLDNSFYDLLASEARLASYVGIASGQLPFEHWFALGRRLTTARGRQVLLSWSGSMFEYLMPLLVMPNFAGTLLEETCIAAVARQIEYGTQRGVPWGVSESCYNESDVEGTYQYRAFGVPGLGLQRGLSDNLVISPYASALALLVDPHRACANLRRMAEKDWLGPYGFYEAIDFTPTRAQSESGATVVQAFMSHHHGMSLLALAQTVLGPRMQERFLRNPDLNAATLLLQERIPRANAIIHPYPRETQIPRRFKGPMVEAAVSVHTNPNTPVPEVQLLSNGRYHVMISVAGGGYSRWNELAITRWREDPTSESLGIFCFITDKVTKHGWSTSFQPTLKSGRHYEVVFSPGRAEFRRQDDQVETYTEIAVSAEDDLEVRRIKLTNRSASARALVVTSYAEVVLAPGIADELHRVFSSLFVEAELLPDQNAILMTRRPRSADEQAPWMFCLLTTPDSEVGPCSYETSRAKCVGRGRTPHQPAMLESLRPLNGMGGPVLDPCVVLRRSVELPIDGSVQLDLIVGAAPTREAATALVSKYQDHRMADRVFEVAAPQSKAIVSQLGASESEVQSFSQLAAAAIFSVSAYRAPSSVLRRNRKGQSGLWGHAISGDLPILLLGVNGIDNLHLVREMLQAHAYFRMRGLFT